MSASPYFFIEVFNHISGKWEKVDLYINKKGEYQPIDVWPWNGAHALFTVVGCEDSYVIPDFMAIHEGLPVDASQEMHEIYMKQHLEFGVEFDYPEVKYFNVADAKLYLAEYPFVEDSDTMDEYWTKHDVPFEEVPKMQAANPLIDLIDRVGNILSLWDEFWMYGHPWSDVRIIYWVNR